MEYPAQVMRSSIEQTYVYGEPVQMRYLLRGIRNVSRNDVMDVAKHCRQSKPAVAIIGMRTFMFLEEYK